CARVEGVLEGLRDVPGLRRLLRPHGRSALLSCGELSEDDRSRSGQERRSRLSGDSVGAAEDRGLNWRQADMSTSATEVLRLGTELYERVGTLITHVSRMGSSLDRSVEDYNRFVSSLESRFLVTARKFPST